MERHRDDIGARTGMWLFLFTEILLFGGLFMLYSMFRMQHGAEFHKAAENLNRIAGTTNTLVLITSSLAMALSIAAIRRGRKAASVALQATTVLLGCVFLLIKYFEWSTEIGRGIYPNSPALLKLDHGEILFYGLYFVMTGLHGLHVIIGISVISFMLVSTAKGNITSTDHVRLENSGLYWHFVDTIWVYLFPLFYLVT
ncbi:MAG: cytochrome c oxidase subunit 3 family protein [Nitrospiraceae bacterium]|nr:cytochrome c oxidase subunit 3 family protein [Nitrospiraceae bacterium]